MMKQKLPFLSATLFIGCLFLLLSSARLSDAHENWKNIIEKDGISISYHYNNADLNAPFVELKFDNSNTFGVNVSWQNEIKFANDPVVSVSQKEFHLFLDANSTGKSYVIQLMEISTLQATMPVEDFKILNLEISKN